MQCELPFLCKGLDSDPAFARQQLYRVFLSCDPFGNKCLEESVALPVIDGDAAQLIGITVMMDCDLAYVVRLVNLESKGGALAEIKLVTVAICSREGVGELVRVDYFDVV